LFTCVSLIVPLGQRDVVSVDGLETYRQALAAEPEIARVEVIVAGGAKDLNGEASRAGFTVVPKSEAAPTGGRVAAFRMAVEVAAGDILMVLDPRRSYSANALVTLLHAYRESSVDLAIGVSRADPSRGALSRVGRRLLSLLGQASLGTGDIFTGLMAIRRKLIQGEPPRHADYGSRLVLELLSWPRLTHCDVAVETEPSDRLRALPLHLDDVRQVKRVLDLRFGTFSRLVQFCMVGASGMVVDLTLYALFQLFIPLATAAGLAILTALTWNFSLNRRLTFNDSRAGSIIRQFATYALGNSLGMAVSMSLRLYLPRAFSFFDDHKLFAAVVGIVIATGISFSMSRWVVFIRKPDAMTPADLATKTLASQTSLQEKVAVS